MSAQHRPLVVDTCCLINLLSAQPPILSHNTHPLHLGFSLSLSERVVGDECLYICEPPKPGATILEQAKPDLKALLDGGAAYPCKLEGEAELDTFVALAQRLDDGEAECLAIAKERGWHIATDDRLAIRVAAEMDVKIVTTARLVQNWAKSSGVSQAEIVSVLKSIQELARFTPNPNSDGGAWWHKQLKSRKLTG